jgi:hypothetical protein
MHKFIDSCSALLSQAQQRNFAQWPILGVYVWRETAGFQNRNTYAKEVDYLKTYISNRLAWIDNELNKVAIIPLSTDEKIAAANFVSMYPNPATDYLILDTGDEKIDKARIQIYSNNGTLVQSEVFATPGNGIVKINLHPGLVKGLYHLKLITAANKCFNGNFVVAR